MQHVKEPTSVEKNSTSNCLSRFLITHQHNETIQCHLHWFMLENKGQKTNLKYKLDTN